MKFSQTTRKPLRALLFSTLLLGPLVSAAPIVLPDGNRVPVLPQLPGPGRDWRKPHTPIGIMNGRKRPPPRPPKVVVDVPKHGAIPTKGVEATSPEAQTEVALHYLKSQKDGPREHAVTHHEEPTPSNHAAADSESASDETNQTKVYLNYLKSQKDGPHKRAVISHTDEEEARRKHEYQVLMEYLNAQSNVVDLRISETKRGIEYLESQAEESRKRAVTSQEDNSEAAMADKNETQTQLDYLRSQKTQLETMKNDTKALTELFQTQAMKHDGESLAEPFKADVKEVKERGIIEITNEMLRTGDDLPRTINLPDVPPPFRNNPHILAGHLQHDMTERGYIVLHDGKSMPASIALGQLSNIDKRPSENAAGLHRTDQDNTTNSTSNKPEPVLPSSAKDQLNQTNNSPSPAPALADIKKPLVGRQLPMNVIDIQTVIWNNYMILAQQAAKRAKMWEYGTGKDGAVWGTPKQYHKPDFGPHVLWGDAWAGGNQRNEPWHLSNPKNHDG